MEAEKNIRSISWTTLQQGQAGSYADSIYKYEVKSTQAASFVERFCTDFLRPCSLEDNNGDFGGHGGFMHKLSSYYSFREIADNTYIYTVCEPFCG